MVLHVSKCKICQDPHYNEDTITCGTCYTCYCVLCAKENILDEEEEDEFFYQHHECVYCTKQRDIRKYSSKELLQTALSLLNMCRDDLVKIYPIDLYH